MFALGLALVCAGACGHESAAASRSLIELERLAFVPAGTCFWWVGQGFGSERALLFDRFEVSRAQWLEFLDADGLDEESPAAQEARAWPASTLDWPATFMTLEEASAFAAWRGMRVPSAGEWLLVAAGPRSHFYPWGDSLQDSVANTLNLGLGRPAACGTFESGRTPRGVYDLFGNVAEWSTEPLPTAAEGRQEGLVAVLGGSHLSWIRPLYRAAEFNALLVDPRTRAGDIGLRCVADAESYLLERAPTWGDSDLERARLRAVGRRWGALALPLLEDLAGRPGAVPGLAALAEGARR